MMSIYKMSLEEAKRHVHGNIVPDIKDLARAAPALADALEASERRVKVLEAAIGTLLDGHDGLLTEEEMSDAWSEALAAHPKEHTDAKG